MSLLTFNIFLTIEMYLISENIQIDLISTFEENRFVHFLSRPMNGFKLPQAWNSSVYTSRLIAQVVCHEPSVFTIILFSYMANYFKILLLARK